MYTLFGITTCDTCRRARKYLDARSVEYAFHDLRADGIDPDRLRRWANACGWETILNRRSTTWRQLDDASRANLDDAKAGALLLTHPTLIKRPVLETADRIIVGFREADYDRAIP